MRTLVIVACLMVCGAAMIAGSYLWYHYMSEGVVWTKRQAEDRIEATSKLHSELTSIQQAQARSEKVDQETQQRFQQAQERHTAARDEFRRARTYRSTGTYVLRTGGCLFMLAGAMIFLFVQKSRN